MKRLPKGYTLRKLLTVNHYWVDGNCGYCVAISNNEQDAIKKANERIKAAKSRRKNGVLGKPVWLVE